jgi:hypothetical protein
VHAVPSETHFALKQQPLAQVLPAQQGSPGPPHAAQMPVPEEVALQTVPARQRSVPLVPGQQGSPGSPHDEQTPLLQARLPPHEVPQQGWPKPPQFGHLPPEQTPPPFPPVPYTLAPHTCASPTHISL